MDQLTFANSASLLTAAGFVPVPLADNGKPVGTWAVLQLDWSRYPQYADSPVAVLTSVPVARNAAAPVQNAKDTWLATLTVKAPDALAKEVAGIAAKYVGKAKCPVRLADDGSKLHVFRLAGAQFSTMTTYDPDFARVESAAAFVPVNGDWRGGDLLTVFRNELPELDYDRARQLIDALNALLDAHAPSVAPPAPYVAPPILQPGQRLLYGNTRALAELRTHGFQPLPVRWGQGDVERNGYSDFMGNWHYNCDVSEHGVGINLKGFALVQFIGPFRADVDAAIRAKGACLVRIAQGDDRPAYLFRCDQGGKDETVYSPNVHVTVRRTGLMVLTGADDKGRDYTWSRDLLTVTANELTTFELHDAQHLGRALESLPPTDRRKTA